MPKFDKDKIVVGLDIGTTKICTIIGEINDNEINIIGVGNSPSTGLNKGVVVNIESTVESIKKAVDDASRMAGVEVGTAYAGIAGGHIKGINSHGVIAVSGSSKEVTQEDVDRVIDAAKAVAIPMDREVIHVIPQEFIVDHQDGIKDPVGMSGIRLEAKVHIVTAAVTSAQNIVKCVERAGYYVEDIVLQPLASSEAVLTEDEKELGVVLVDIGGGTTDIVIYSEGGIRHTAVLAIGGNFVTNDIAIGLRTPTADAEEIKKKYGCAMSSLIGQEEIKVAGVGGRAERSIPRRTLAEVIQPRIEEIFELVCQEIKNSGFDNRNKIAAGVVVTGGTAIMAGISELAEKILSASVRIGVPKGISGLVDVVSSPIYATGVGLVLYGVKNMPTAKEKRLTGENLFVKVFERMKEWFGEFF